MTNKIGRFFVVIVILFVVLVPFFGLLNEGQRRGAQIKQTSATTTEDTREKRNPQLSSTIQNANE
jgi:hypothetical protein